MSNTIMIAGTCALTSSVAPTVTPTVTATVSPMHRTGLSQGSQFATATPLPSTAHKTARTNDAEGIPPRGTAPV